MPKQVHIPKVGMITFPDGMTDDEISQAAGKLHTTAITQNVSKFMEADPTLASLSTSERLKSLSGIAQMLEKYPRLAQAVDKGITPTPDASENQSA